MVNQACIYTGTTTWRCECATGWADVFPDDSALTCTRSLDNCQNGGVDVCRNGASCVDMDNTFMCICSDAYTGPTCEELYDPCSAPVCINGGSCTMYVRHAACIYIYVPGTFSDVVDKYPFVLGDCLQRGSK